MRKIVVLLLFAVLFASCSTHRKRTSKKIAHQLVSAKYANQFTGFLLIDPSNNDTIYKNNSSKYFTPASNTKIFTLYASLKLLPERIPALRYLKHQDTLYIQGTGDPSFLHPHLKDSTASTFISNHENVSVFLGNFYDERFGPGWSWEDYHWYYSPERSPFPVYGNVVTVENKDTLTIVPKYFADSIVHKPNSVNRDLWENTFYVDPTQKDTLEIPFVTDPSTIVSVLESQQQNKIHTTPIMPEGELKTLMGIRSDSVYKRMMQVSDNFLAEQLLVLASSTLSDSLSTRKAITFVLENHLNNLKHPPRWVDGSGLSRYNLFTPASMVHVLHKMYNEITRERLFLFFPAGGHSGTMESWYPGNPDPYIFAKTGSLGNNHNLSGYLLTKSGKTLIFSFMNNHFMENSSEIKKRMQSIFEIVRDTY